MPVMLLAVRPSSCDSRAWTLSSQQEQRAAASPVTKTARFGSAPEPLRLEPLDAREPPTFVMRGGPHGPGKMVFIHGMCGHALGYAQSFQWSAAKYGVLIAPQGDVPCAPGSPWAKWSGDTNALDARIVSAFQELGQPVPLEDVALIGYSQGASRAEALARKWPKRYTRLILIAGPSKVSPYGLGVRSALMMAGSLDRQDLMQASARAFAAAGRRARYMALPDARHGSMGSHPEQSMNEALKWLFDDAAQR